MKRGFGFSYREIGILKKLNSPAKIQDFLNKLRINFEESGESCMSPSMVLKTGKAHCMEGAMFAACVLRFHGYKPLVVDLESTKEDYDHVISVFKEKGYWGAIGKTNHAVLRYREPVYKSIRELVMSFFHEYFLNSDGKKTLRKYSLPVNLSIFDDKGWMTSEEDVWYIPEYLAKIKHYPILKRWRIKNLRKADDIEIKAGKLVEEKKKMIAVFSHILF